MTPVRLEPGATRSRVKHSTTEPLPSLLPSIQQQCKVRSRPGLSSQSSLSTLHRIVVFQLHILYDTQSLISTLKSQQKYQYFYVPYEFQRHEWIQRGGGGGGGQGVQTPLENHKNIGFLAILVPIPLKITNLPSQH